MASCLSEECTKMVNGIYSHLEEAQKCYNNLPKCIRKNVEIVTEESLGTILAKGIKTAKEFREFYDFE